MGGHFFPYQMKGPGIEWNFRFAKTLAQLDRFALSLPDGHIWTAKQRKTYERRVREFRKKSA
jgi:hypothetical protein